ncbi:amidohydrolase family protein [Mycobacterium sp. 236(2023)]|uniref:amidohydrolase family protein n=1 Tax=Mycobacterium sp. 236(2023) TaxID=3038163 RepID=UPI00241564DB|nr:amidohydrolase family protein [Mycobacterium sp. 236(2023)]MDG4663729.1 amidohydrolase family protein [Mycobacterium sp. 236(2023)]
MSTFHNAVILPVAGEKPWFLGWLSVDERGRISGIGQGSPPADAPQPHHDLRGCFLAPGFVSAHSHIYTGGMRGVAASSPLYEWVSLNGEMLLGSDAEDLYWMTLAGGLDHLAAGITSVYNFTQSRVISIFDYDKSVLKAARIHPSEFVTRQVDGLADAGIRFVTSVRLDDEQVGEDDAFAAFDTAMRHLDTVAPDLNLGGSVYGAVQWSSSPATAERERMLMDRYGITNQAHFVETAEQIEIQQSKFGWYDAAGVLGPEFAFGHFVHPTEEMVSRVRETGTSVVWQPMSNGRLGSGFCDVPRLLRDAVTVGMGVDDQSCTDISDPFENMRMGLFSQRALHSDAAILTPADVLTAHTLGSAAAIGVADRVGSLEVGKFADFLVVDPSSPHTGPIWDPVATYVLACGLRNLTQVVVGGELVWTAGEPNPLSVKANHELTERMVASAAHSGIRPAV